MPTKLLNAELLCRHSDAAASLLIINVIVVNIPGGHKPVSLMSRMGLPRLEPVGARSATARNYCMWIIEQKASHGDEIIRRRTKDRLETLPANTVSSPARYDGDVNVHLHNESAVIPHKTHLLWSFHPPALGVVLRIINTQYCMLLPRRSTSEVRNKRD